MLSRDELIKKAADMAFAIRDLPRDDAVLVVAWVAKFVVEEDLWERLTAGEELP